MDWAQDTNEIWWGDYLGTLHTIAVGWEDTYTVTFPLNGKNWFWFTDNFGDSGRTSFGDNC